MSAPDRLAVVYANDEQLAIRCDGDISILTPNANLLAGGTDGVFDASDPWTLTSASNDFEAQGVAVGNTVKLTSAVDQATSKKIQPWGGMAGVVMAVGSASGHSLTLRRLGLGDGEGLPPALGGLSGVTFSVETLAPQIEQASDELNRRCGIDPRSSRYAPPDVYDLRELNEACMLIVLLKKYGGDLKTENGAYPIKIKLLQDALAASLARLQVRWGALPDAPQPAPVQFGTRVGR